MHKEIKIIQERTFDDNSFTYPKKEWGIGEWNKEPDFQLFTYRNHYCLLNRNILGGWCGYVGVDTESIFYNKNYSESPIDDLDVHGGITFGAFKTLEEFPSLKLFWLGFDCSHCGDFVPAEENILKKATQYLQELKRVESLRAETEKSKSIYRTFEYAQKQLKGLVDQIIEMENKKEEQNA